MPLLAASSAAIGLLLADLGCRDGSRLDWPIDRIRVNKDLWTIAPEIRPLKALVAKACDLPAFLLCPNEHAYYDILSQQPKHRRQVTDDHAKDHARPAVAGPIDP